MKNWEKWVDEMDAIDRIELSLHLRVESMKKHREDIKYLPSSGDLLIGGDAIA